MPSAGALLRQLSGKEGWKSRSRRWNSFSGSINNSGGYYHGGGNTGVSGTSWNPMQGGMMSNTYGSCCDDSSSATGGGGMMTMMSRKRVMVVVDESSRSKHAMMWALTHVTNKGDWLTLLHVTSGSQSSNPYLATSLGSLCKASKPEVEVEALVIQGPKLATILSQVKKLEVAILVLGQKKPSPIINCLFGISGTDDVVEQCINNAECLAIGVRKQSRGMGGYLISTRYQRNFWLLA